MPSYATYVEPTVDRPVFEAWSIEIPASFAETFIEEDHYWHAWDEHRSVSLTSIVVTHEDRPVSAKEIVRKMRPEDGTPIDDLPDKLVGWATTGEAAPASRASRILSGLLAVDGRLLLVTVTSDDLDWARRIWLSIRRRHVVPAGLRKRPLSVRGLRMQPQR